MYKKFWIPYLFIFCTLLLLMSLSRPLTERIRGNMVALWGPMWESLNEIKRYFAHPFSSDLVQSKGLSLSPKEEIQHLQLQNQLLENEISHLSRLLNEKKNFEHHIENLKDQTLENGLELAFYQKYMQRLQQALHLRGQAIAARVIFRSLDNWNSTLWINVGAADNPLDGPSPIAKYSPVVVGDAVIGIIDYIGQHQSRVRLITDPSLTPSVRVARGGEQEKLLAESMDFLLNALDPQKSHLPLAESDQIALLKLLNKAKSTLQPQKKSWYLAKGELQGSLSTRRDLFILKGTGFNYDFADEEGEARDLRTGKLLNSPSSTPLPILKLNDLLVTTGMDGIFPPGLKVAMVTKIELLKEGDYFYELEARPIAGNLHELSLVFVLPPFGNLDEIVHP